MDPILVSGTDGVGTKLKVVFLNNVFGGMLLVHLQMCTKDRLPLLQTWFYFMHLLFLQCIQYGFIFRSHRHAADMAV